MKPVSRENKNNLKASWKILKDIIIYANNQMCSDKKCLSEGFDSYFVNVGPNLSKQIPSDHRCPTIFMQRNQHSMAVLPISQSEVISIIKNLKSNSPGWDSVPATVVKTTYSSFIEPLTHVLNMSLTKGIFPSEMKLAKVIPLFKACDPMLFSNYKPVPVLPLFSKILERLMYNQLLFFINKHSLLYSYQFGFRGNHSLELNLFCFCLSGFF